jgi:hypothetical protein
MKIIECFLDWLLVMFFILVFVIGFLWLTFHYPCFYFLNDVSMILYFLHFVNYVMGAMIELFFR